MPLTFDGKPYLTSGVFRPVNGPMLTGAQAVTAAMSEPDLYVPDPVRRISAVAVPVGGDRVDGVDLVAAVLRRVLAETERVCGGPLPQVAVVVPPGWGPPRQRLLVQAAQFAGVRQPTLVPAAVAVVSHTDGVDVPVARWVAVCDLGAQARVCIVRRNVSGLEVIAELDVDAGGDRIDDAIADHVAAHVADHVAGAARLNAAALTHLVPAHTGPANAVPAPTAPGPAASPATPNSATPPGGQDPATPPTGPRWAPSADRPFTEQMMWRAVKEATMTQPVVVVPAVNGGPVTMLTAAQVQAVAAPVLDTAVTAVRQAVRAADVAAETGCGLILVGGTAHLSGVADRFAAGTGLTTRVPPRPELATVCAAARTGIPDEPPAADQQWPGSVLPRGFPPWSQLMAPLLPALASVLLAGYATLAGEGGDRWPGETYLVMNTGQLAMAAVLAVVAGAAIGAHFGPALRPDRIPAARRPPAGVPVAVGLLAATGLAVATAAFYAVGISAYFRWPYHAQLLRWTLIPAVPLAVVVAVAAWLVYRGVPEPGMGWGRALTMPHHTIVLAAVGMAVMTWAYDHRHPGYDHWKYLLVARCGAVVIGVASAYAVADRRLTQVITAVPLAILMAILAHWFTTGILAGIWIVAVLCWWIRRSWQIGTYGIPSDNQRTSAWA